MNQLKTILTTFTKLPDLYGAHICLYAAIYAIWEQQDFQNPFWISRSQLMSLSKIKSTATYHRCIQDLISLGYLDYEPSYHPLKGSQLTISTQPEEINLD